jgi:Cys-tRNA(Pro)/Cys-tRNA(Cys) deacylase
MPDQTVPDDTPATPPPGSVALTAAGVPHRVVAPGPSASLEEHAAKLGIPPDHMVKTIVVRRAEDDVVLVLVPGSRRIDWRKLRAHLGVSRLSLPEKAEAERLTGYVVGSITPFGAAGDWPVIADAALADIETIALGSGERGVNIVGRTADLVAAAGADVVDVTEA